MKEGFDYLLGQKISDRDPSIIGGVGVEEEEEGGGRGAEAAESCEDKCKGKPNQRKKCLRKCKKNPAGVRNARATSGGQSGPTTETKIDCDEECRGRKGKNAKKKCKKQCNKRQGKGKGGGNGGGKNKRPKRQGGNWG